MARNLGSWWIKDGIDGRRIEAQGFASTLNPLSGFNWTQDHGDAAVLEKDFVETASYTEKIDQVDAVMMSSHGNPNAFSVSDGSVSTSDTVRFGKTDLEIFATHACKLLEHTPSNSVGRWSGAFARLHYMFGFHNSSYSGGGQNPRGQYFAMYAAYLHEVLPFMPHYTLREAWKLANVAVEGSNVEWAYLRATAPGADTYNERLGSDEPIDPVSNRSFWTAHGSC
ncbi:hypothetical protein G8A07_18580 [Roseateles sp. DAIF2]|uniref:DUF6345 domain-containing protein n=1 Tax=Roseateles sp. DAIF2 TaxID=2714952 RepID=UPI0018A2E0E5|nr:DUF6345 domain-containing protein [Roseateles sp. DAIF2]QPF74726.1 hypothetical protein G8A07_18580 [Roseateles sp. DAIF2]